MGLLLDGGDVLFFQNPSFVLLRLRLRDVMTGEVENIDN